MSDNLGLVNPDEPEADEMELDMKEQMENEKKKWAINEKNYLNNVESVWMCNMF